MAKLPPNHEVLHFISHEDAQKPVPMRRIAPDFMEIFIDKEDVKHVPRSENYPRLFVWDAKKSRVYVDVEGKPIRLDRLITGAGPEEFISYRDGIYNNLTRANLVKVKDDRPKKKPLT